jgi:uncharacterized protein YndB with AHSA1/START domain
MVIALIVVGLIVVALLIAISTRPNSFRIERTMRIAAPPERVFPFIQDFHEWTKWSPWEKLDADLKRTYSGTPAGVGATYGWDGKNAGAGRMEITQATPASRVLIKLDFIKPFEAHNTADFTIDSDGGGSVVTWAMYGPQGFMNKAMSLVMSMDKLVGGQFDEGLANLKRVSETAT